MLMGISNGFANVPPTWNYFNTGSNHTILILPTAKVELNNDSLAVGDYIGVFYDSLGTLACAGYAKWEQNTIALAAWGADAGLDGLAAGEIFKWKIWDSSDEKEFEAFAKYDGESFPNFDSYATNGMSGVTQLWAYPDYTIELHEGWNFVTTPLTPILNQLDTIFQQVDSLVVEVFDFDHRLVLSSEIDYTDQYVFSVADAYKIKMADAGQVHLSGYQPKVTDSVFSFAEGSNLLSYFREQGAAIESLFLDHLDKIELIKDEDGQMFWPTMSCFELTNLIPGRAYEMVISDDFNFEFPDNDSVCQLMDPIFPESPGYYDLEMNTGASMSLGIPISAWEVLPEQGDEIGIFSETSQLVGSGVFVGGDMALTIWGNLTSEDNGVVQDGYFTIKLWHQSDGFEDPVVVDSWLKGDSIYQHGKVAIVETLSVRQDPEEREFGLELVTDFVGQTYQAYIAMEIEGYVELQIYNLQGQLVSIPVTETLSVGKHVFGLQLHGLSSGVYFFQLQGESNEKVYKVPLFRFE